MTAGLLAGFATRAAMDAAGHRLRAEEIGRVETHAPQPGEDSASTVPLAILAGGLLGIAGAFLLQVYATTRSYPIDIGGRPDPGWPALVPMAFEMGMLCAVLTGFVAFLIVARLPALYRPIDEVDMFRRASRDLFFVAVEPGDPAMRERARTVLHALSPVLVEEFGR